MREIHVIDARAGTTAEKLRVAAYCRVSSDSDDQLNSFLAHPYYTTPAPLRPPRFPQNTLAFDTPL